MSLENTSCLVTNPTAMAAQAARMEAFISATWAWNAAAVTPHGAGHAKDQQELKPHPLLREQLLPDTVPLSGAGCGKSQHVGRVRGGSADGSQAPAEGIADGWACTGLGCLRLGSPWPPFPCIGPGIPDT